MSPPHQVNEEEPKCSDSSDQNSLESILAQFPLDDAIIELPPSFKLTESMANYIDLTLQRYLQNLEQQYLDRKQR